MSAVPAGAADENARRRRSSARRLFVVLLACACILGAARCGGGDASPPPGRLLDGSPARAPATRLAGIEGPAILTTVRTERVAAVDARSLPGSCLANDWGTPPAGVVVERTGASGTSVTFLNASHRQVLGCDYSAGPHEDDRRWCGVAAGQLHAGRLRDPRLDLGCSTRGGDPLGFVWVQPAEGTRYVTVRRRASPRSTRSRARSRFGSRRRARWTSTLCARPSPSPSTRVAGSSCVSTEWRRFPPARGRRAAGC